MIKLQDICREFQVGDQLVHALDHVTLEIEQGDYVSVMGPSGSGKSTLLNLVGILDHASSGRYWLNDQDVTALQESEEAELRNRTIGFVFQSFHLVPRLTAAENVELPLVLMGMDPQEREGKVRQALEQLGMSDRAHHRPNQLSGGQRQRVAIARAAITRPTVLLADEPTGNLDQHSGQDVIHTLEMLNEQGITLIVVTHDLHLGNRSRRSIQMIDGRIESDTVG